MCDGEAFGIALVGLYKIYAIRILSSGNEELLAVGYMVSHLLAKQVEDADHAKVFTFNADESVGGIGGKAECQVVFVDTIGGLIINGDGINPEVCVDV